MNLAIVRLPDQLVGVRHSQSNTLTAGTNYRTLRIGFIIILVIIRNILVPIPFRVILPHGCSSPNSI